MDKPQPLELDGAAVAVEPVFVAGEEDADEDADEDEAEDAEEDDAEDEAWEPDDSEPEDFSALTLAELFADSRLSVR